MSDSQKGDQEPNLELPSLLGFGRKKKNKGRTQSAPAEEPTTSAPPATQPVDQPRRGLAPATGAARRKPPMPPPPARTPAPSAQAPTAPETAAPMPAAPEPDAPVAAPVLPRPTPAPTSPTTQATPAPAPTRSPQPTAPEPAPLPEPEPMPVTQDRETVASAPPARRVPPVREPAADEPTDAPATAVITTGHPDGAAAHEATDGAPDGVDGAEAQETRKRPRRELPSLTLPVLDHWVATAIAGVLAGLVGVAAVYLAQRGCELVRGVGSCGGSIGVLGLLLVLAAAVVVGASLLRLLRVNDATSTSLLGVGMLAVIVLLFLLGAIDSGWMVLVVPVLTALTFLLAHWVTGTFVESAEDRPADFR